jgi:hypothetical protein
VNSLEADDPVGLLAAGGRLIVRNCSRSGQNDAKAAKVTGRAASALRRKCSLVVVVVARVVVVAAVVLGAVTRAGARAGAGRVVVAAVVRAVVVVARGRRSGAARVVRVLGLVARAAQVLAGLVFPAARSSFSWPWSSCRIVLTARGGAVPIVGLLVESRLVNVPARATPAMSRTPPMMAEILIMSLLRSVLSGGLRRIATSQFAAGKTKRGEWKASVKLW